MYNLGFAAGQSLARQAFNSTAVAADCDNYELFQGKIVAALGTIVVPPNPPTSTLCHFLGESDGMLDQVAQIQDTCTGICIVDGAFAGEVAAKLYCALSIALGGLGLDVTFLPQVVGLCGQNFEASCFAIFEDTAEHDVAGCVPFTVAPFTDVFDETSNNQCLYDPIIPP